MHNRSLPRTLRLALLITLLTTVLAIASPLAAQDAPLFSITVQASGTAVGFSTQASLEFGVEVVGTDLEIAIEDVEAKVSAISEALGDYSVTQQDIQNIGLQITSQDLLSPTTGAITGDLLFHVRSVIQVIIHDAAEVQTVIKSAVSNGATSVNNLTLGIDDLDALEQQARAIAIANAYDRAEALADGFNLTLGEPVIVTETIANGGLPVPVSGSDLQRTTFDSDTLTGSASPLSLTVNVTVVFSTQSSLGGFSTLPDDDNDLGSGFTGLPPETETTETPEN